MWKKAVRPARKSSLRSFETVLIWELLFGRSSWELSGGVLGTFQEVRLETFEKVLIGSFQKALLGSFRKAFCPLPAGDCD